MAGKLAFSGILGDNQTQNPDFYNWNRVKIRYCDGASLTGDMQEVNEIYKLYYRGQRIWQAVIDNLLRKGMDKAEQTLLSGCSAGVLTSFLHCENFKELLPETAEVKCLGDAGFFIDEQVQIVQEKSTDVMLYRIALSVIQVMVDFQAAERQSLEEPVAEIGLEPLCAMVNNNLRCYDLAMDLSSSTMEALTPYYAEQVNFEDTCKGFLEVAKEAVHQTVNIIFEDAGVKDLLANLYQKEWYEGTVTEYLVATFGDYFNDVKLYIEERSFRRFVEACLEEAVVVYIDHPLTQKNYIKEKTIERMRVDEEVFLDFFSGSILIGSLFWLNSWLRQLEVYFGCHG